MVTEKTPRARRTPLAAAGARAATASVLARRSGGDGAVSVIFLALLLLGVGVAVLAICSMLFWMIAEGGPRVNLGLLTNRPSTIFPETAGYRVAIIGSLYVVGGVILLIVPLGVGAAIYMEEYADKTRWWNRLFELNIQNLAGVPAIVYGILALAFIAGAPLNLGLTPATGAIALALLVLPTVILAAREAIRAVPPSIREGALALGATQWQTIWRQVLPASLSGILTGVILAVARAIGEAAPLLLVGATIFLTREPSLFREGWTALPVQIFEWAGQAQPELRELAAAGVLIMVVLVLLMNSLAIWLRNRFEQKW
jgi:phosphate transport system permease protein